MSLPSLSTEIAELLDAARNAAKRAYAPYSRFTVGAAIRTRSGRIFTGCNIENASYSVTLCAERVAGSQAILTGEMDWDSLVVVSPQRVSLCGTCRQFCFEFAPEMQIWTGFLEEQSGTLEEHPVIGPIRLSDLLPSGMTLERNS